MEEKQKIFTEFMDEFVKLDTMQKNKEIVEKQKYILAFLLQFASSRGIQFEFLKSREINDIETENGTNDDYLEAIMVYTENIEELMGLILKSLNTEYK